MIGPRAPRPWRRRLTDALLFPVALLVVLLEDVLWVAARDFLSAISHLWLLRQLRRGLGRLPGWAALPCFAVPELLGRVGEFWAFLLLFHHHVVGGVLTYVVVRVVATLIVLFIFQACEPALMRLRWFAWAIDRLQAARDWARARLAPVLVRLREAIRGSRGRLGIRFRALRRRLRRRPPWTPRAD